MIDLLQGSFHEHCSIPLTDQHLAGSLDNSTFLSQLECLSSPLVCFRSGSLHCDRSITSSLPPTLQYPSDRSTPGIFQLYSVIFRAHDLFCAQPNTYNLYNGLMVHLSASLLIFTWGSAKINFYLPPYIASLDGLYFVYTNLSYTFLAKHVGVCTHWTVIVDQQW